MLARSDLHNFDAVQPLDLDGRGLHARGSRCDELTIAVVAHGKHLARVLRVIMHTFTCATSMSRQRAKHMYTVAKTVNFLAAATLTTGPSVGTSVGTSARVTPSPRPSAPLLDHPDT